MKLEEMVPLVCADCSSVIGWGGAGITTVRFRLSDLCGKRKIADDSVFLEEIRMALK